MALRHAEGATAGSAIGLTPNGQHGDSLSHSEVRFANNLMLYRRSLGISQRGMADRLGIPRSRLSLWESGRSIPAWKSALAIATFFEVTIGELFPLQAIQELIARSRD